MLPTKVIHPLRVYPSEPLLNNADMFEDLLTDSGVPWDHIFTVIIGRFGKDTYARWYLHEPIDLIGNIMMLTKCDDTADMTGRMMTNGNPGGSSPTAVPRSYLIRENR